MIFFATPMYGGQCFAGFHRGAVETAIALTQIDMPFTWSTPYNESLITRGRNKIAHEFLKTDFQALMFIDADIEFKAKDVAKLWNLDVDVCVGAYPMKRMDYPTSAWVNGELVETQYLQDPLEVDYAGTGFMMIKRGVFEKLQSHVESALESLNPNDEPERMYGFFQDPVGGLDTSEDYFFCREWKKIGGKVILDPSIKLKHWGTHAFGS